MTGELRLNGGMAKRCRATLVIMANNLVRKTLTDKNGRVTTRWVKPVSPAASPALTLSIPQRASAQETVTKEERERMLSRIVGNLQFCDNTMVDVEAAVDAVWRFENGTLAVIAASFDGEHDIEETAGMWINMYNDREPYLRELFVYRDAFDESTDANFIEESIQCLRECGDLPPMDDYSQAVPELQKTIRNLLSATETVIAEKYEMEREGNDPILPADLRRLIIERPSDIDRINDILLESPEANAERISMMLDSDSPSIAEGVL